MMHQRFGVNLGEKWCILRTSGSRTLPLMESLAKAGFDVWTPAMVIKKRRPRSHKTFERTVPILATFVFVRAIQSLAVAEIAALPRSSHPEFSVFRDARTGRVPLVADIEIAGFRAEEEKSRVKNLKSDKRTFEIGQKVRVTEGVAMGMTGIVERGKGKDPVVNFGGGFVAKISGWLLNLEGLEQTSTKSAELQRAA